LKETKSSAAYTAFVTTPTASAFAFPPQSGRGDSTEIERQTFPSRKIRLGWTRLVDNGPSPFPEFNEWDDPKFPPSLPNSVELDASAGRQIEGFLDVSHFAFVQSELSANWTTRSAELSCRTHSRRFRADYISIVSNYSRGFKHLNRPVSNGGDFLRRGCRSPPSSPFFSRTMASFTS